MVQWLRGGVLYTKHQGNAKALPGLGIYGLENSRSPPFPLPLSPVSFYFISSPNRKLKSGGRRQENARQSGKH